MPAGLPTETTRYRVERRIVAHEDAQALLQLGGGLVERLGRLDPHAHIVALRLGGEEEQRRGAGLEQVAILVEPLLENDRLILA